MYLNRAYLDSLSPIAFRDRHPYPWMELQRVISDDAYELLRQSMPDLALFRRDVGFSRGYGQAPHERYLLHYGSDPLPEPWRQFITELKSAEYRSFLQRMLGFSNFVLTFEWHYAWKGCSVSPHCDAARKVATHLFYFNDDRWNPDWGGQTLILDSGRRHRTHSAPTFDDFQVTAALEPHGNRSLLFQRTAHSWHGVRPLDCPEDALRKLFKVTVNQHTFQVWWRGVRGKDADGYPLR